MLTRRLALAGAAATLGGADRVPVAAVPLSRLDTAWWRNRHQEKLAELRSGRVDLLWLGDSITQDWEKRGPPDWQDFAPVWHRFYGDRHAVNLGVNGDDLPLRDLLAERLLVHSKRLRRKTERQGYILARL